MGTTKTKKLKWLKTTLAGFAVLLTPFLFVELAYASQTETFGSIAKQITGSFEWLARLIIAVSYLAGLGFAIGAIMKFKQHKDNPTQIPVGTPIALIFIAAALLFLPSLLKITGETIFQNPEVGGPKGTVFGVKQGGDG